MKRQIVEPSKAGMRFFTPQLLIEFNSTDDEVANRADEDWEKAIRGYRAHLASFRKRLPVEARKLAKLLLHDAEILSCVEPSDPFVKFSDFPFTKSLHLAVLNVTRGEEIITLIYALRSTATFANLPHWNPGRFRRNGSTGFMMSLT